MKKVLFTIIAVSIISILSYGQSTLGPGVMGNSLTSSGLPHNFSNNSWNPDNYNSNLCQQVCQHCHTPHNALAGMEAPLWNQGIPATSYTLYQSMASNTSNNATTIDSSSALCLSCHDGTVAISAYGGPSAKNYLTGSPNLGSDLRNDHPISINYATALAEGYGELRPMTYLYSTWDTSLNDGLGGYRATTKAVSTMLDPDGKVQCISCHGAHSNYKGYQLRMSNRGSALCLACHNK
jgi:predicted CXXCH cytochrome family protein